MDVSAVRNAIETKKGLQRRWDEEFFKAVADTAEARAQGAHVNETLSMMGMYVGMNQTAERTNATFEYLLHVGRNVEPVTAIVKHRQDQVAEYQDWVSDPSPLAMDPGWRLRMSRARVKPTARDVRNMEELADAIQWCGFTDPPKSERPENWQPGFEAWLRAFTWDTLVFDAGPVQMWRSANRSSRWPVACWSWADGSRLRKPARKTKGIVNGVPVWQEFDGERKNTQDDIAVVLVDAVNSRTIVAEYTEDEMYYGIRNVRSTWLSNGYGEPESAAAMNLISGWLYSLKYNISRFRDDSLPRGLLTVMSDINQQQLEVFREQWRSMFSGGSGGRWALPILSGKGGANGSDAKQLVNWTPFDLSQRDMEYGSWMNMLIVLLCGAYGIHPEEIGYEGVSPVRPPLSEANPEDKIKFSQDRGLRPLLRFIATTINHCFVWKLYPGREYTFEFTGQGDYDPMMDSQAVMLALQAGRITPEQVARHADMQWSDAVKQDSIFMQAIQYPMPLSEGIAYVQGQIQMEQQQQMMEQQQMAAEDQYDQQMAQQQAMQPQDQPDDSPEAQDGQSVLEALTQQSAQTAPGRRQQAVRVQDSLLKPVYQGEQQ